MKTFIFKARVYYSDTDCGGIVYHTKYLDFAEHARTEMLREALPSMSQNALRSDGVIFVVKSISIDYQKSAFLDDELEVHTSIEKAERFSAVFLQEIKRNEETVATLRVKVGSVSIKERKIVPIAKEVIEALS